MPFKKGQIAPGAKVFQPGQSGNPKGRSPNPKSFKDIAEMIPPQLGRDGPIDPTFLWPDGTPMTHGEMVTVAIFQASIDRKHPHQHHMAALWKAYEVGRPRERLEVSGVEGAPVQIEATTTVNVSALTSDQMRRRLAELDAVEAQVAAAEPHANGQPNNGTPKS